MLKKKNEKSAKFTIISRDVCYYDLVLFNVDGFDVQRAKCQ